MPLTVSRSFGVEIEFCYSGRYDVLLAKLREAGLSANIEWDNDHVSYSSWKIVEDCSVSNGAELVSPILRGEDGLEQIKKATKVLREAGCTVDRTCGLHVHVNAVECTVKQLVNVLRRYAANEHTIDTYMPRSRRENRNSFCYTLRNMNFDRLETFEDMNRVGNNMRNGRFHKVNVSSFVRQGTIEFRHHSGTLNATKINNWVQFCIGFLEGSINSCGRRQTPNLMFGIPQNLAEYYSQRSNELRRS